MFLERISADTIRALGKAYLIPDGDCLYIVSDQSHWTLCVTNYVASFPLDLVDIIVSYTQADDSKYLQWDILCSEVDLEHRQYLPAQAKTVKTLTAERHPRGLTGGIVRDYISAIGWVLGDRALDLTGAFKAGVAHPIYPGNAEKHGQFARGLAQASKYIFQMEGRVVAVNGDYFRSFYDMGLEMTAPSVRRGKDLGHPLIAAQAEDMVSYVFGFLPPDGDSGITVSADGRALYADATILSWAGVSDAQGMIDKEFGVFSPSTHDLTVLQMSLEERLELHETRPAYNRELSNDLLMAIGILRWKGVAEENILAAIGERRMPCYEQGWNAVSADVTKALQEMSARPDAEWHIRSAKATYDRAAKTINTLRQLGVDAELGDLRALWDLLKPYVGAE